MCRYLITSTPKRRTNTKTNRKAGRTREKKPSPTPYSRVHHDLELPCEANGGRRIRHHAVRRPHWFGFANHRTKRRLRHQPFLTKGGNSVQVTSSRSSTAVLAMGYKTAVFQSIESPNYEWRPPPPHRAIHKSAFLPGVPCQPKNYEILRTSPPPPPHSNPLLQQWDSPCGSEGFETSAAVMCTPLRCRSSGCVRLSMACRKSPRFAPPGITTEQQKQQQQQQRQRYRPHGSQ